MQFGVFMGPTDDSMDYGVLAVAAEDLGFESIWAPEHSHIPTARITPWPGGPELPRGHKAGVDLFVALTYAAARTTTIRVGTGVCVVPERHHITLAKEVASLDLVSRGRLLFGVGAGWNLEEIANHGVDPRQRWGVLEERLAALKVIWSEDEPEFHGRHVDFDPIWQWPKPTQRPHPPILVGGGGPRAIRLAVTEGTEWMPFVGHGTVALADRMSLLAGFAAELGRDPLPVTVFGVRADPADVERHALPGVTRVIFRLPPAPAETVLPLLAEAARIADGYR